MKSRANQKLPLNKIKLELKKSQLIKAGDNIIVALSGGPDSVFLAEALHHLRHELKIEISACHYNHKLRGKAGDNDQKFVEKYCMSRNIPLIVGKRRGGEQVKGEDDARNLRYKFFEKVLERQGRGESKIATAHHMDDLAETYLMRLIRGSGLKGLSSILPQRKNFIRPLLRISKKEILNHLDTAGIDYCTDLTNYQDLYFRNKIRNQLMPQLMIYNPQVVKKLAETAEMTSSAYQYIENRIKDIYDDIVSSEHGKLVLRFEDYSPLLPLEKAYLVIYCIDILGGRDYNFGQVMSVVRMIDQKVGGKMIPLPHSLRVELRNGKIYLTNTDKGHWPQSNTTCGNADSCK